MELIAKAPAKINLILNVLGKREDHFHEVEMVMTSIDLADMLTFTDRSDTQIHITSNSSFMPLNQKNIVYEAAEALRQKYNVKLGCHIHIDKKIPIAAGLGGGSADAAATLRALNQLWGLSARPEELSQLGEKIGSDIPYCLQNKTSIARGRGEQIQVIEKFPACWVILVKPPKGISSWTVFKDLKYNDLPKYEVGELCEAIALGDYERLVASCGNALEGPSATQRPVILQIKEKMLQFGADAAFMSGTGPTVLALAQKRSKAERIYNALRGFCKEVYMVRTL